MTGQVSCHPPNDEAHAVAALSCVRHGRGPGIGRTYHSHLTPNPTSTPAAGMPLAKGW